MNNNKYEMCKCSREEIMQLKLIENAFNNTGIDESFCNDIDWDIVFEEMNAHAMTAVAIDTVCTMGKYIPDSLIEKWFLAAMQTVSYNEKILHYQNELTELLKVLPGDVIILKGMSTSRYYPNPLYRCMGDIDILTDKNAYKQATEFMVEHGYTLIHDIDESRHHVEFQKDDMIFELHKEPGGISSGKYGDILRRIFDEEITDIDKITVGGYEFNSYNKKCNGLVLLLHIVNHIDFGLGLRQICDWMGYVRKELDDEYWNKEFGPILRETRLEKLAIIVTKVCKMYLGLTGISWCDGADEKICAEFMRYVLDKGNFGHKKKDTPGTVAILGRNKEFKSRFFIVNFIRSMQREGYIEMKRDNKTPKIKCLVWTYPIMRYLVKLVTGKKSIKHTRDIFKEVKQDKSLRDKLEIYK